MPGPCFHPVMPQLLNAVEQCVHSLYKAHLGLVLQGLSQWYSLHTINLEAFCYLPELDAWRRKSWTLGNQQHLLSLAARRPKTWGTSEEHWEEHQQSGKKMILIFTSPTFTSDRSLRSHRLEMCLRPGSWGPLLWWLYLPWLVEGGKQPVWKERVFYKRTILSIKKKKKKV